MKENLKEIQRVVKLLQKDAETLRFKANEADYISAHLMYYVDHLSERDAGRVIEKLQQQLPGYFTCNLN